MVGPDSAGGSAAWDETRWLRWFRDEVQGSDAWAPVRRHEPGTREWIDAVDRVLRDAGFDPTGFAGRLTQADKAEVTWEVFLPGDADETFMRHLSASERQEFKRRWTEYLARRAADAAESNADPTSGDGGSSGLHYAVEGGRFAEVVPADGDTGDKTAPDAAPDTPPDEAVDWGEVEFPLNTTLPDGRVASVRRAGSGVDDLEMTFEPPLPTPEPDETPGADTTTDVSAMSASPGCLTSRTLVAGTVAAAIALVVALVAGVFGGGSDGVPVSLRDGTDLSGSPIPSASDDGQTDETAAPTGPCYDDSTHDVIDEPIDFRGLSGPLPELYQYISEAGRSQIRPTPELHWEGVPDGVDGLGIVMTWLPTEPADRGVDPWSTVGPTDSPGVSLWIVTGIDPSTDTLPAGTSGALPDPLVEHIRDGGQVRLEDGSLSQSVFVGPRQHEMLTAEGEPYRGPFVFEIFAYCGSFASAVDEFHVDQMLNRRAVARGWFFVENPWA